MAITVRPVAAGSSLAGNRLSRSAPWLILAASLAASIALFALLSAANKSEFSLTGAVVVGLLLHMVVTTALSASIERGTAAGVRLPGREVVVWRDPAGTAHAWELC